jgi:DNA-binding response OmpR family regulator
VRTGRFSCCWIFNLPDMSGMSILQRLKANEHTRRMPVMVLTTPDGSREIQCC